MTITGLPNHYSNFLKGADCIHDPAVVRFRDNIHQGWSGTNGNSNNLKHNYFDMYKYWLSKSHSLQGIEDFSEACYTNGTSESFSHFFLRYNYKKRLRLAKAEYFYSQMMARLYWKNKFAYLEDDELKEGDVLLLSVPFSDTGNIYEGLDDILNQCDKLRIPVMLDMAFLNTAKNLAIDLSHECIEYVVTSLSKVFPVAEYRIGIRLQRRMFEDQLYVINEDNYNYINLFNCHLATQMMSKFEPDYICSKYDILQKTICEDFNVEPSSCVIFGIDHNSVYNDINRGRSTNRLCFSKFYDGRKKYDSGT